VATLLEAMWSELRTTQTFNAKSEPFRETLQTLRLEWHPH